jgi:hypothetical protein
MEQKEFTAPQLLMIEIINNGFVLYGITNNYHYTPENVDEIYEDAIEFHSGAIQDGKEEVRNSGEDTGLDSKESSRHYECDFHAIEVCGKWIGFNYWHGGGKHGEPSAIDWISDAVFLDCKQEARVVNVFSRLSGEK